MYENQPSFSELSRRINEIIYRNESCRCWPYVPTGARRKLGRVRKAAKLVRWPNNGLRHSFASYRLAAIYDAPRVSVDMGHTSPQMLYNTYRELVLPEEAERYWKIAPAATAEKVVAFSATPFAASAS